MHSVGAYEAKTHLSQLLARVAKGERITITKYGRPVAVLVPANERPRLDRAAAVAELRRFGAEHRLGGFTLRQLVEEGRRY